MISAPGNGYLKNNTFEFRIKDVPGNTGCVGVPCKVMLNLSVGQSIVELEKNWRFNVQSQHRCLWGSGISRFFLSGNVLLECEHGNILCGFSLNLANLRIGQKLEEALIEIEKKTAEALEAKKIYPAYSSCCQSVWLNFMMLWVI